MPFFKKKKPEQAKKYYSSESDSEETSSEEATRVHVNEYQKAPTKKYEEEEDYSDYKPEFARKKNDLPPGTAYVVLPEVSDDVLQDELDLHDLRDRVGELRRRVNHLEDLLQEAVLDTDDSGSAKRFHTQMEDVLMYTAIIHKNLTSLPPGLEVADFLPEERELYDSVSSGLFKELSRISELKNKFANLQQRKLRRTMQTVHPDLTDEEIEQKMDEAIMEGTDLLSDSSQMFAQQIIDDRYKREEAKIALMYAKEQRRELEQIEKSIAQLHQMSVDLAALVQGQGEILDQMEMSINSAVQDSVKGLKMLEVAEAHKISARKKKIIIGIIVGVVIGVTVLTIVGVTAGVIALCS